MTNLPPLSSEVLSAGIRSRFINGIHGLSMHVLEANVHRRTKRLGIYQAPGAIERMQGTGCAAMRGVHLIDGAGHWVQQETPEEVCRLLAEFLQDARYRRVYLTGRQPNRSGSPQGV